MGGQSRRGGGQRDCQGPRSEPRGDRRAVGLRGEWGFLTFPVVEHAVGVFRTAGCACPGANSQYTFALTSDASDAATAVLAIVKKSFPDVLSAKFNELRPALLEVHGAPDGTTPGGSGASTPASYTPAPPASTAKVEPKKQEGKEEKKGPIVTGKAVEVSAELQASAEDLWGLLTEESKIPMWSRSAAQVSRVDAL